jgi:hypothetical protein
VVEYGCGCVFADGGVGYVALCVVCGVVCVSLSYNKLGAAGGAAMAGAVQRLTSLTTLQYV